MQPQSARLIALVIIVCVLLVAPQPIARAEGGPMPPGQAGTQELAPLVERLTEAVSSQLSAFGERIQLLSLTYDGTEVTVDLSAEARPLLGTAAFESMFTAIDDTITELVAASGREGQAIEYQILIAGEPPYAAETTSAVEPDSTAGVLTIQGKKVVLSPGHGWRVSGSGWALDRGYWWGIVEDFINADLVIELNSRLSGTGADVRPARQLNKNAGNHASGHSWWEMGSSEYVRSLGAPGEVWGSAFTSGADRNIVAPPEYANWIGADALVSIHNNGGRGCGTETWYDTSNGHQANSQRLAQLIQNKLIERLRSQWNANWCNRGVKGSNGGYGENRRFRGPAVIVELAFMDTESDNAALRNATFRSIATTAIAEALLEYFGGAGGSDADGGNISYGGSRTGTINPAGDTDDYFFNASANDVVEIRQNKNNSSLDSFVELSGPNGFFASDDDSGGNLNSFLRRTLPAAGQYRIRAKGYGSSTGAYTLSLTKVVVQCTQDCQGENRWISFGQTLSETINPANDRDTYYFSGTAGRVVSIRMNRTSGSLDSFLELWNPNNVRVATNDDGGGDRNAWLVYTLPSSGTYRISAYSWNNASTGGYSIKLESITGGGGSGNLARGKPVAVSSVEFSGVEGWRATDGNTNTRWSSRFSDPQWIYVDLGQNRYFNQVVLKWEAAYGRSFGIYYQSSSMCSNCWNQVYATTSGRGGTNTINFGRVSARYVLMYGTARGTSWGYSLWEFEIYDTSTTTVPIVPPDDPDKGENTAPVVSPLPPTEGDKDVMLSGDGEYGQEETPLAGGDPIEVTQASGATQTVTAFINAPNPAERWDRWAVPAGYMYFEGEASSQVNGSDVPIVAYRWRSDRQGEIGTQAAFTLPVSALLPGAHTIYFKAQNELGTWSEEVSTTLIVERPYRVLLPLILR